MANCCKTHCEEERGIKGVYVRNKKKAHIIHFCSGRFLLAISLRDISPYLVAMLLSTMKFLSAIFLPCYFFSISFVVAPDQGCHACTRQRSHMVHLYSNAPSNREIKVFFHHTRHYIVWTHKGQN